MANVALLLRKGKKDDNVLGGGEGDREVERAGIVHACGLNHLGAGILTWESPSW